VQASVPFFVFLRKVMNNLDSMEKIFSFLLERVAEELWEEFYPVVVVKPEVMETRQESLAFLNQKIAEKQEKLRCLRAKRKVIKYKGSPHYFSRLLNRSGEMRKEIRLCNFLLERIE
jgi:hypothetical protein